MLALPSIKHHIAGGIHRCGRGYRQAHVWIDVSDASKKGGCRVALDDITLLDVYRAVGEPPVFSDLVTEDTPECLVEQAVNFHLSATLKEAEAVLLARFGEVTLGMLSRDFDAKAARRRKPR